jgi:DNA-binding CsgD family transcriptional regulator
MTPSTTDLQTTELQRTGPQGTRGQSPRARRTLGFGRDITADAALIDRILPSVRTSAHMDLVFGGPVTATGDAMQIMRLDGARTAAPRGLIVDRGHGLGGRVLQVLRPMSVPSYLTTQGITHLYDRAVEPEAMETVAALPVIVGSRPRALLYIASRARIDLGDCWFDSLGPLIRSLAHRMAVEDEVARRLGEVHAAGAAASAAAVRSGPSPGEVRRELAAIASLTDDPVVRDELQALAARWGSPESRDEREVQVGLRPREIDVLRELSAGRSNQEIADALGLRVNTVKSYLKSAMSQLHVRNRMQAVLRAQELGML